MEAFLAPNAIASAHEKALSQLMPRGQRAPLALLPVTHGTIAPSADSAFSGFPLVGGLLVGLAAAAASTARASVARRAKPRKKGVRIVEGREIPWNIFGPKKPLVGKVVKNHEQPQTLTQKTGAANWETTHITIDTGGKLPYVEGQSIGVIPPGPDKKGETPAKMRLYSIASSAVGDNEASSTVSLCVKRLVELDGKYANREVGEDKPDRSGSVFPENKVYRGVSSNYVGDLREGDEILITGPTGQEMLLPEDPEANLIMIATGTGIAPMRGYLRLLFNDKVGAAPDGSRQFKGLAWLFLGVPYSESVLYDDEHREYAAKYPAQFRYDYAVSREQTTSSGMKMYVHNKVAEYADEVWKLLQSPKTHIYVCGLKGMMPGMEECFGPMAEKHGQTWDEFITGMKKEKRYHVEVY